MPTPPAPAAGLRVREGAAGEPGGTAEASPPLPLAATGRLREGLPAAAVSAAVGPASSSSLASTA